MVAIMLQKYPVGLDLRYIYVYELNEKKLKARGSDGWVLKLGRVGLGY